MGTGTNSMEWLDVAIQISGLKEKDTFNAAYRIANHLLRFYKDSVLAACKTQAMALGKNPWPDGGACCSRAQFLDKESEMWDMESLLE